MLLVYRPCRGVRLAQVTHARCLATQESDGLACGSDSSGAGTVLG